MTVYAVASDCTQYIKERLADLKFGRLLISPVVIDVVLHPKLGSNNLTSF